MSGQEAKRIINKYPDRIPVICEKHARSNLPEIEKKKFLVPGTMLAGEFKYIIHKHINQNGNSTIQADQTIYLFCGGGPQNESDGSKMHPSPKAGALMSEIYDQ